MHVPLESESSMLVLPYVKDRYQLVARGKWKLSGLPVISTVPDSFEIWANIEVACPRKCVL